MFDDFVKSLTALETLILVGIFNAIYEVVKKQVANFKGRREKKKYSIDNTSLVHERVKNAERKIMLLYRNLRMFVFHFWNGDTTYADLSLLKIAIRHEITLHDELPYITEHYQGRPIPEMFYASIRDTFKNGHCVITKADTDKNPPLKEFFETWELGAMLWIRINDKNEDPAAILVMGWPGGMPCGHSDILAIKRKKRIIEDIYAGRPIHEDYLLKSK